MMREEHLILGGNGFIGRHVALKLARLGDRVTVASRKPLTYHYPRDVADRITWTRLELGSADWDSLVKQADIVHHYAWSSIPASANSNAAGDLIANVGSTLSMLEALRRRGDGRVIFSSSGGTVYGRLHCTPVREGHPINPISAYGASKATAEIYLNLYRAMHGMDCRIARIANPFGAGQDLARGLGAVTNFLHKALADEPIEIWGTGDIVRDYIHISDVVDFLIILSKAPKSEEAFVFNVGSGVGTTLNAIVNELELHLKRKLKVVRTKARFFDVPVSVLAIDLARNVLEWIPKISFSEGIARTINDFAVNVEFSTLN